MAGSGTSLLQSCHCLRCAVLFCTSVGWRLGQLRICSIWLWLWLRTSSLLLQVKVREHLRRTGILGRFVFPSLYEPREAHAQTTFGTDQTDRCGVRRRKGDVGSTDLS